MFMRASSPGSSSIGRLDVGCGWLSKTCASLSSLCWRERFSLVPGLLACRRRHRSWRIISLMLRLAVHSPKKIEEYPYYGHFWCHQFAILAHPTFTVLKKFSIPLQTSTYFIIYKPQSKKRGVQHVCLCICIFMAS